VSKLGYTNLIFLEHGSRINSPYYREVLLMQELLPMICSIAGDMFVFQQDNAPTHRAHDMVELLCHETPRLLIVICGQPTLLIFSQLISIPCDVACPKFKFIQHRTG